MARLDREGRIRAASWTFWQLCTPRKSGDQFNDPKAFSAYNLIVAAFRLYEMDWKARDIRDWDWPRNRILEGRGFHSLREMGPAAYDAPWTVLLRRAVELLNEDPAA